MIFGTENIAMFDWPWSVVHFFAGVIIGVIFSLQRSVGQRRALEWGFGLLALWELVEIFLRLEKNSPTVGPTLHRIFTQNYFAAESTINSIGDLVIGSLGIIVGYRLGKSFLRSL